MSCIAGGLKIYFASCMVTRNANLKRLRMTSPDLTLSNIEKLGELFPNVITETLDVDGNPVHAVDFDAPAPAPFGRRI